jgi:Tfp pilus assembly protein PilN
MSITTGSTGEMTVTRARIDWATVPRVNLLPPEVLEGRRFRRTQVKLAGALAGAALLAGAATMWAQMGVSAATQEGESVAARTSQLRAQEATYAEVPRVLAKVDAAKVAREQAMASDVLWYRFLDELAVATPTSVWLGTLDISMTDNPAAATAKDALSPAGLGEVTVSGTASVMPEVASWLTAVGTVHGLDTSRLQSATRKEEAGTAGAKTAKVAFTTAVSVTADALSHRYDRKVG